MDVCVVYSTLRRAHCRRVFSVSPPLKLSEIYLNAQARPPPSHFYEASRESGRRARKGNTAHTHGRSPGAEQAGGGVVSQCTRSKRTGRRSCTSRRAGRCRRRAHTERRRRHRRRSDRRNRPHTKRRRRRHWCTPGRKREEGNAGAHHNKQRDGIQEYNRARRAGQPAGGAGEPGLTGQEAGGRERGYGQKEAEGGGGGGRGVAVSPYREATQLTQNKNQLRILDSLRRARHGAATRAGRGAGHGAVHSSSQGRVHARPAGPRRHGGASANTGR